MWTSNWEIYLSIYIWFFSWKVIYFFLILNMFVNLVTWNCGCWLILTVFTFRQHGERKQWNNQNDFERFIFASYNTKFVISLSYWRMESSTFIFICVTFYLAVRQLSNVVLFLKANMCWSLSHFETINSKKPQRIPWRRWKWAYSRNPPVE